MASSNSVARDRDAGAVGAARDQHVGALALRERLLDLLGLGQQVGLGVDVVERVQRVRVLLDEALGQEARELGVPVGAAELVVAVGGHDADARPLERDDRDVERAAAEVVDEDALVGRALLGEAVRVGRRGRLVDQVEHVQAGQLARQPRLLALLVAEVGGHGDHDVGDLLAGGALGVLGQRAEHERGDAGRRPLAAAGVEAPVGLADVALDELGDVVGIEPRGALGQLADDHVVTLELDDARRRGVAVHVAQDLGAAVAVDVGDARVRRPEVDAEHLAAHWVSSSRRYTITSAARSSFGPSTRPSRRTSATVRSRAGSLVGTLPEAWCSARVERRAELRPQRERARVVQHLPHARVDVREVGVVGARLPDPVDVVEDPGQPADQRRERLAQLAVAQAAVLLVQLGDEVALGGARRRPARRPGARPRAAARRARSRRRRWCLRCASLRAS